MSLLSAEEERALARRFRDEGDLDAAWQLVLSHLRFVVRIARGYDGYGLPQADLIQEGNIGLMKAVKRFDPDVGVRLVSFAGALGARGDARVHPAQLADRQGRDHQGQRKLFFNLRSAKKRLGWMNSQEVNSVADDLGVNRRPRCWRWRSGSTRATPPSTLRSAGLTEERPSPAGFIQDVRFEPASQVEEADWTDHSRGACTRPSTPSTSAAGTSCRDAG